MFGVRASAARQMKLETNFRAECSAAKRIGRASASSMSGKFAEGRRPQMASLVARGWCPFLGAKGFTALVASNLKVADGSMFCISAFRFTPYASLRRHHRGGPALGGAAGQDKKKETRQHSYAAERRTLWWTYAAFVPAQASQSGPGCATWASGCSSFLSASAGVLRSLWERLTQVLLGKRVSCDVVGDRPGT